MSAHPELHRRSSIKEDPVARLQRMIEIRLVEDRVQKLFADGLVHGTTHTCQGQEAVAVGIAAALEPNDPVTCTYRGHGLALALGLTIESVLGEIMGRVSGSVGGMGGSMHLCEPSVGLLPTFAIVGAGIPVAAGAGLTAQVLGTGQVAAAVFGDGASNIGAFHEGVNLAAIWKLPVVFICENNQYGEYSRIDKTTPIENIADRAVSFGIPGRIVDGQDVDAVIEAVSQAAARARSGAGPTLLELKTYRYAGHSRGDAAPYRPEGELEQWLQRDPIDQYRERLIQKGLIDFKGAQKLEESVANRVEEAVGTVLRHQQPGPQAMFRNILADETGRR